MALILPSQETTNFFMKGCPLSVEAFRSLKMGGLNPVAARLIGPITMLALVVLSIGETVGRLVFIPIRFVASLINLEPKKAFQGAAVELLEVGRAALRIGFCAVGVFITIAIPKPFCRQIKNALAQEQLDN